MRRPRSFAICTLGLGWLGACGADGDPALGPANDASPAPSSAAPEPTASDGSVADERENAAPSPTVIAALEGASADRFEADLRRVARERETDRATHDAIADACAAALESGGFTVERQAFAEGVNIIGTRAGTNPELPAVIVGAHYDHIPGCAGADDNASGTAAVMEVARVVGPVPTERTVVATFWDAEEKGLLGSRHHAKTLVADQVPVEVAISLDAVGFTNDAENSQRLPKELELLFKDEVAKIDARQRRADFIGVLFDPPAATAGQWFIAHAKRIDLQAMEVMIPSAVLNLEAARDLGRSDHASFWEQGIPAVLINDTAEFRTGTYHCREAPDLVETLDIPFAFAVTRATAAMVLEVAGP